MRVYGRNSFHWNGDTVEVEKDGKKIPLYSIRGHWKHAGLWNVIFPDGEPTYDFYNLERAKEHALVLSMRYMNGDTQETDREAPPVSLINMPATPIANNP